MGKYKISIVWSEGNGAFVAEVPELPGCMADGATFGEAHANAEIIIGHWIAIANETGREIPKPRNRFKGV